MESGWGEKFEEFKKLVFKEEYKKLNFDLVPKNLGKLKVEISYEDGKKCTKINTDTKV